MCFPWGTEPYGHEQENPKLNTPNIRFFQLSNSSHMFAKNEASTVKDGNLGELLAWEEFLGLLSPLLIS
jgi:hypothetical protein